MYEIVDRKTGRKGSSRELFIHVDRNTYDHLDRYLYKQKYGEDSLDLRQFLFHLDGDYMNCNPDNMVVISASTMAQLRIMGINDDTEQELRMFALATCQLISKINERGKGKAYYASWVKYYELTKDKARRREYSQRTYHKNIDKCRETARRYAHEHKDEIWAKKKAKINATPEAREEYLEKQRQDYKKRKAKQQEAI